ncbi:ABC-three component system middle component 8 [Pontibacter burrus]|uniref:ABC-three component system middle component 8 n=1 Tax=Pontibacter burrus TaxID=2704466 RepID=UPI0037449426
MIRPDRHTNLDYSVVNISSLILKLVKSEYIIKYDALLETIVNKLGHEAKINYPYALNFLFLLGKITYQQETDSFKYNEIKQTILQ